jgi:hypothetical protein
MPAQQVCNIGSGLALIQDGDHQFSGESAFLHVFLSRCSRSEDSQFKRFTFTVSRQHRQGLCYSKTYEMLNVSIWMLQHYLKTGIVAIPS